jgi:hypothetical protein
MIVCSRPHPHRVVSVPGSHILPFPLTGPSVVSALRYPSHSSFFFSVFRGYRLGTMGRFMKKTLYMESPDPLPPHLKSKQNTISLALQRLTPYSHRTLTKGQSEVRERVTEWCPVCGEVFVSANSQCVLCIVRCSTSLSG